MQKATLKMIKTRAGPPAEDAAGEAARPSGGRHPDAATAIGGDENLSCLALCRIGRANS
jgi:hypothetical protein